MILVRRLLVVVSSIFLAAAARAQSPCVWSEQPGQIVQDCGVVGVGILAPWGGLHLKGAGQTSNNPLLTSTSGAQNRSTLFLQDSGGGAGNGGMIAFGAGPGHFAAIKGLLTDGNNNTLGHLIFATRNTSPDTNLTERMRIFRDGRVAVGSNVVAHASRFSVTSTDDHGGAIGATHNTVVEANTTQYDYGALFTLYQNVAAGVTNGGLAVGTHSAAYNHGPGVINQTIGVEIGSGVNVGQSGTVNNAVGLSVSVVAGNGTVVNGTGMYISDVPSANAFGIFQVGNSDRNYFAGKTGIGVYPAANTPYALDVAGDANFSGTVTGGNIQAKYQDLAEWVPSRDDLPPGTVVVLDPSVGNGVMRSTTAYDTTVAGVVSAQPGILLGEKSDRAEQIATTGRVRVRVDATAAPIRVGDLLVTGNKPGTAMPSQPVDLGGIAMHRPGTIVGKALQALPSGEGEILVLLSLQ